MNTQHDLKSRQAARIIALNTERAAQQRNAGARNCTVQPLYTAAAFSPNTYTGPGRDKEIAPGSSLQHASGGPAIPLYPTYQPQNRFIARITELIEANIDDDEYTICRLCREAGTSRSQLHKKLKKWTGLSTSHFIHSIRLRKAKALLVDTGLNISEVAYEVGFKDRQYFSRVFTRALGQSPREFRKQREKRSLVIAGQ
ncbi:MAG: helix-turn-helix transcriptional regulator [Phaeodactylibacter sp.]|nr:helix-turn-helix transcriptional regulator [Phaeodactylibacter sp.]